MQSSTEIFYNRQEVLREIGGEFSKAAFNKIIRTTLHGILSPRQGPNRKHLFRGEDVEKLKRFFEFVNEGFSHEQAARQMMDHPIEKRERDLGEKIEGLARQTNQMMGMLEEILLRLRVKGHSKESMAFPGDVSVFSKISVSEEKLQ